VQVQGLDQLEVTWQELTAQERWSKEQADALLQQVQDAEGRYWRRHPHRSGEAIAQRYRDRKNKRIRRDWKQAHIDLAKNKKRLTDSRKAEGSLDD
jgi:hypothetical protein